MQLHPGVFRATEDAVDALARLDELVASGGSAFSTLLMLRTAQAIVASNDRPSGEIVQDGAAIDGAAGFAALLGWWYAGASREFVTVDRVLSGTACALDSAVEMTRSGRTLTLGLLDEAVRAADVRLGAMPEAFDPVLQDGEASAWSPLLLCAALASGDCGKIRGIPASIARAVAPLSGGLTATAVVLPASTDDLAASLHALARSARDVRRRVLLYRERTAEASAGCDRLGRGGPSARALVALLASRPAVTVGDAARALSLSAPSAGAAVDRLLDAGRLQEITGRGRDRVFVYAPAIAFAD